MYLCVDCLELFDTPAHYTETHGFSSPPYEEWTACPCCGGNFTDTIECDVCGEWIDGEYIDTDDDQVICNNCYTVKNICD